MSRLRPHTVKASLSDEEKKAIASIAKRHKLSEAELIRFVLLLNQMIISKNPQFTGISARQQLEFTTHLLLTD